MPRKIVISGKYISEKDFQRVSGDTPLSFVVLPKLAEMSEHDIQRLHTEARDADLVIMAMFGSNPSRLAELKLDAIKTPKAYWSFDSHHQWPAERNIQHFFDKLFISHSPYRKFFPAHMTEWLPCCFVRFGTDELIQLILTANNARNLDIAFPHKPYNIGNRNAIAHAIHSTLKSTRLRYHVGPVDSGDPYMRLIQNAHVVLNVSLIDDLNIRNFEAWALNRIPLATPTPDHGLLGELGNAAVFFRRSLEDFEERLGDALDIARSQDFNTAPLILNGHLQVHRYVQMVNTILNTNYTVKPVTIPSLGPEKFPEITAPAPRQTSFNAHGSNIGVIALSHAEISPTPFFCNTRLQIEDNIGEAIHIHWRNIRLDFTMRDFLSLSQQFKTALAALGPKRPPATEGQISLPDAYARELGPLAHAITGASIEHVRLNDLKVVACTQDGPTLRWTAKDIPQSTAYAYLEGDTQAYVAYHNTAKDLQHHNAHNFETLFHSILKNGYPYNGEFITLHGDEPYIRDGQHRACILHHVYGNIRIPILRLHFRDGAAWRMKISPGTAMPQEDAASEAKTLDELLYVHAKTATSPCSILIAQPVTDEIPKLVGALFRKKRAAIHVATTDNTPFPLPRQNAQVPVVHTVTGQLGDILGRWKTPLDLLIIEDTSGLTAPDIRKCKTLLTQNGIWAFANSENDALSPYRKNAVTHNGTTFFHGTSDALCPEPRKAAQHGAVPADAGAETQYQPCASNHGKILIVRADAIGDGIIFSSALSAIRNRFPDSQIDLLSKKGSAELYEHCPHIDRVIPFEEKEIANNHTAAKALIERLRATHYDLSINSVFSRDYVSDLLATECLAGCRIAFRGDMCNVRHEFHNAFTSAYTHFIDTTESVELHRYNDLLRALGADTREPLHPQVWLSPDDESAAEKLLLPAKSRKLIAVFPGALHYHKRYPRLGEALEDYADHTAVVLGGPDALQGQDTFCAGFPGQTLRLVGKTTVRQMIAIIRKCAFYVGSDSSGAHAACAAKIPNIVLLGGGHFGRFFPYSNLTSVVSVPLSCYQCNWKCPYPSAYCVSGILPEVLSFTIAETLRTKSVKPRIFIQGHTLWPQAKEQPAWRGEQAQINFAEVIPVTKAHLSTRIRPCTPVCADAPSR